MGATETESGELISYRQPQPAERKSQHARIVRDLGSQIVAGGWHPGDNLPPEGALCAQYSVSRSVLREATRVLVAKGLVVSRQRAGVIVRPQSDWHLLDPDVLIWFIQSKPRQEFIAKLIEIRRIFEPAAAGMAAKVASDSSLHAIARAYERMEAAKTRDELLEPDLAFHRLIAEATGNELITYIGNMLSLALRESIKLSSSHPNTHALSLPRHKAILTALLNRDSLAAQQATLVQLRGTQDDFREIIESESDLG
jgi:GntR family galactonate operon transcriptional repressor